MVCRLLHILLGYIYAITLKAMWRVSLFKTKKKKKNYINDVVLMSFTCKVQKFKNAEIHTTYSNKKSVAAVNHLDSQSLTRCCTANTV